MDFYLDGEAFPLFMFLGSMLSSAFFLTMAVMSAVTSGGFLFTAGYSFLAWWSYLTAHYTVNGKFVDKESAGKPEMPSTNVEKALFVSGSLLMVSAFPTGVTAVRIGSYPVMFLAQSLFLTGYVVGHYGVTGKLL